MRPHTATYEELKALLDEGVYWWFNFKLERHGPEEIVIRDTRGDCEAVRPGQEIQTGPAVARVRHLTLTPPKAPKTVRDALEDMRRRCALAEDREALSLAIGGLDCADELLAENRGLKKRLAKAKNALDAVAAQAASIRRKLDP